MIKFGYVLILFGLADFMAAGCIHITTRAEALVGEAIEAAKQGDMEKYKARIKETPAVNISL